MYRKNAFSKNYWKLSVDMISKTFYFNLMVLCSLSSIFGQVDVIEIGGGNPPSGGNLPPSAPSNFNGGNPNIITVASGPGNAPPSGASVGSNSGRNFVCVPIGTCPQSTIDVRIITPGNQQQSPCPAGQEPCYTATNNTANPCGVGTTQCGVRLVSVTSTADGFAERGAYPWQVFMVNQSGYAGSGVLIDPYHVLTAAHKVQDYVNNPSQIAVYMGIWETNDLSSAQYRTVSRISLHPQYNRVTLRNDLAVLRLQNCFILGRSNYINTACLPTQNQNFVGQNCVVSGWGQTSFRLNDAPTMRQKQVTVPIVSYATCRASYSQPNLLGNNVDQYLDPNGEICAGGQPMRDACTQDGGAPLVCPNNGRYTVAGIVIWGKGCGSTGVYGVYTNVAYYSNWIQSVTSS